MNMRRPGSTGTGYLTRLMVVEVNHSVDALDNYAGYFKAVAEGTAFLPRPAFRMPLAEPQVATVTANSDSKGRVQVKFDWPAGGTSTEWIRVMSRDAGGSEKVGRNRGFVAIPETGDQVMVGFVQGHPDRPYVMGGMFHGKTGAGGGLGNNIKSLSSKSGHTVELNDGGGITIKDKTGGNHVVVDGNNKITVTASQQIVLQITDGGSISIDGKNITITGLNIKIDATQDGRKIDTLSQSNTSIKSTAAGVQIEAAQILSGKGNNIKIHGSQSTEVTSGGNTDVKGSNVKLNCK